VARWDGALDAPQHYQVKGLLAGATLAAMPSPEPHGIGRPGLRNATLQLDASDTGGTAQLGLAGGALEFPGVFEEPLLPFDQLAAQLQWTIQPAAAGVAGAAPKVVLNVKGANFANADAQGTLEANWATGAGSGVARGGRLPGVLQLDGRIAKGNALRVARYLPLGIPESARPSSARAPPRTASSASPARSTTRRSPTCRPCPPPPPNRGSRRPGRRSRAWPVNS